MFEWRFRITPGIIPQPLLETAYFADWGRVPRLTQTGVQDNYLIIRTDSASSGTIHVPMEHLPLGIVMESTESLLSGHEPYILLKELVRGSLGRFYRRLFDWQMVGFLHPPGLEDRLNRLAKRFSNALIRDSSLPETEQDFASILGELALLIIDENKEFAEQSISWRTRNNEQLPVILGIGISRQHLKSLHEFSIYADILKNAFHAVIPMPTWRELESQPGKFDWERLERQLMTPFRFGFQIVLGPLISFCADALPQWLLPNLSDEDYFGARVTQFVNTVAERYGHLAHSWILANRFMDQSLSAMPQSRTLTLIRTLAQQLRSRGIRTPIIVGINQPWGEYALKRTPEWEQVQVAETLMGYREIDTFLLEMDIGCGDYTTLPRDPMSIGNMIDQWSFLGKKVCVSLSVPSAGNPLTTSSPLAPEMQWSEEKQKLWTETLLLTLLSKRTVQGIFWSCLQDTPPSGLMPFHYGLLDAQQTLKPAFKHFTAARKNLLQ